MGRWGLPAVHLLLLPSVLGLAFAHSSFEPRLGSCQEPSPQPHDDLQLEEVMRFNLLQTSSSKTGLALAGAASTPNNDGEADVARIMADRITMAKGDVPVDVPGYVTWRVASTNTAMDNNEHFLMYREGSERDSDDAWSVAHQHNTFFNKDGWDRWVLEHRENKERVRWVLERQVEEDAAAPVANAEGAVAASPAVEQLKAPGATPEAPAQLAAQAASRDEVPTALAGAASGSAAGAAELLRTAAADAAPNDAASPVTQSNTQGLAASATAPEFTAPSATALEAAVEEGRARAGDVTAEPLALESTQTEEGKPATADSARPTTDVTAALVPLATASDVAPPANTTEPARAGADVGPDAATWIVQVLAAAAEQGFKVDGSQGLASNSSDPSETQPGSPEWIAEVLAAAVNQAAALQSAPNASAAAPVDSTLVAGPATAAAAAPAAPAVEKAEQAAAPGSAESPPGDITDWLAQILTAAAAVLPPATPAPQVAGQPAELVKLSASVEKVPAAPEEPVVQQRGAAQAEQAADEGKPVSLTAQATEVAASSASSTNAGSTAAAAAANSGPTKAAAKPAKAADKRLQARLSAIEKFLGLADQPDEDKVALLQRQQHFKNLAQHGPRPAG